MTLRDAIRARMAAIRAQADAEIEELSKHLTGGETWLEREGDEFLALLSKILKAPSP